jgi:uncharacterized RDD family membrane protein YckC
MMDQPPMVPTEGISSGAGFWIRALARIIDMGFGWLLGIIAGVVGGIILAILQVTGGISPGWEHRGPKVSATMLVASLLGSMLYHCCCEGLHGATLGKLICGLRVVRQDGGASTMPGALVRSLAWFFDGLFFGLVGYTSMSQSRLKQRYGDVWGKTIVIRTKDLPGDDPRSPSDFVMGFSLGCGCYVVMLALGLVLTRN